MQQYELKIDPTGAFQGAEEDAILNACGLIPIWVGDWLQNHQDDLPLKSFLDQTYGFGLYAMGENSSIDADGVYRYPGDPDLAPLISIDTPMGRLFQYQYGIVAIPVVEDGIHDWFITRMD